MDNIGHPFRVGKDPTNGYYVYHEETMEIWRYFAEKIDAQRFAYDANGNTDSFSAPKSGIFRLFGREKK